MKKLALAIIVLMAVNTSFATVLMSDNFDRYNGQLITTADAVGGTSTDGLWTVHSTTAGSGRIQAQNGAVVLNQKTNKEDINTSLSRAITAGETFYAAFDVTVGDLSGGQNVTANSSLYFAHFKDTGTMNFPTRIGITAPTAGGNFAFTLSYPSSTFVTPALGDGVYGQTYRLVASYNMDGTAQLWVNPVDQSSASLTVMQNNGTVNWSNIAVSSFALREVGTATGTYATLTTQTIDNLVVGTSFADVVSTPEPATMALLGLGGLFFARRK